MAGLIVEVDSATLFSPSVNNSSIICFVVPYLSSSISDFFHYGHGNEELLSQTQLYIE